MKKYTWLIVMVLVLLLMMTGCMARVDDITDDERAPSGFFRGVWHGWIAPVTLVLQFADRDFRMYDPYNTGFSYEIGFYIAVISGFGSIALMRRRKK